MPRYMWFILATIALIAGYFIYGKIVEKVFVVEPNRKTPALTHYDGVDYLTMPKWKLWLIQLLNIAGVGPVFGIRPAFSYERSLEVLQAAHEAGLVTKSNLILGMGETREEVEQAMTALVEHGVDILTITQYLRPSKLHHPIDRWVKPAEFVELSDMAEQLGFAAVMSGPMVRSSYRAGMLWGRAMVKLGWPIPENLADLAKPVTARQEASTIVALELGQRPAQGVLSGV